MGYYCRSHFPDYVVMYASAADDDGVKVKKINDSPNNCGAPNCSNRGSYRLTYTPAPKPGPAPEAPQ